MFDWRRLQGRTTGTGGLEWVWLVPGGLLVLLGLLILVVPHLLEMIVAAALMVAGGSLLVFGWRVRQAVRHGSVYRYEARDAWPH
jgi:hypothetical protein